MHMDFPLHFFRPTSLTSVLFFIVTDSIVRVLCIRFFATLFADFVAFLSEFSIVWVLPIFIIFISWMHRVNNWLFAYVGDPSFFPRPWM